MQRKQNGIIFWKTKNTHLEGHGHLCETDQAQGMIAQHGDKDAIHIVVTLTQEELDKITDKTDVRAFDKFNPFAHQNSNRVLVSLTPEELDRLNHMNNTVSPAQHNTIRPRR